MPLAARSIRLLRRTLDVLLIVLIVGVVAILVLARGLPLLTGGATFVVGGPSMEPAIPVGAVVHAVPVDPAGLRPGDVVSIKAGARQAVFTHRIVRLAELPAGLYLETRGDANDKPDPALVPATDTIGRVDLTVPIAGFGLVLLSSVQGVLFLVALAGVLLAGAWLLETLEDELLDEAADPRTAGMRPESAAPAGTA